MSDGFLFSHWVVGISQFSLQCVRVSQAWHHMASHGIKCHHGIASTTWVQSHFRLHAWFVKGYFRIVGSMQNLATPQGPTLLCHQIFGSENEGSLQMAMFEEQNNDNPITHRFLAPTFQTSSCLGWGWNSVNIEKDDLLLLRHFAADLMRTWLKK